MSENWAKDISDMHAKFGVNDWFEKNKDDKVKMQNYRTFVRCANEPFLHRRHNSVIATGFQ